MPGGPHIQSRTGRADQQFDMGTSDGESGSECCDGAVGMGGVP